MVFFIFIASVITLISVVLIGLKTVKIMEALSEFVDLLYISSNQKKAAGRKPLREQDGYGPDQGLLDIQNSTMKFEEDMQKKWGGY